MNGRLRGMLTRMNGKTSRRAFLGLATAGAAAAVAAGAGERLFGETGDERRMRLVRAQTVGDNITFLTYQRAEPGTAA